MLKPENIQAFAALAALALSFVALIYSRRAILIGKRTASSEMKADALGLYAEGLKRLQNAKYILEEQVQKHPNDRDYELIENVSAVMKDFEEGSGDSLRKISRENELYLALATLQDSDIDYSKSYLHRAVYRAELHERIDVVLKNDIERVSRAIRKLEGARGRTVGQFLAELFR